jgi:hypothetical protein
MLLMLAALLAIAGVIRLRKGFDSGRLVRRLPACYNLRLFKLLLPKGFDKHA